MPKGPSAKATASSGAFWRFAKGSAGELRTQLYIGIRAGSFSADAANPIIEETKQVASMIEGLRKKLGGSGPFNALFGWLF